MGGGGLAAAERTHNAASSSLHSEGKQLLPVNANPTNEYKEYASCWFNIKRVSKRMYNKNGEKKRPLKDLKS